MLKIINSDVANLRSVTNTLAHLNIPHEIVNDAAGLRDAERIILPGVGAFGAGMNGLHQRGVVEALHEAAARGTPILGVCLGMHLLFESSEELGQFAGLGLLPGHVIRLPGDKLKVPHIGWNQLCHDGQSTLLAGVPNGGYAYFVHSYYANTTPDLTIATTDYGIAFPSVVGRGNVFGAQFHPEKSQGVGMRLLVNFAGMTIAERSLSI